MDLLKILDFNYNLIGSSEEYLNPKRVSKLDKGDKELSFIVPYGLEVNNIIKEQYFIEFENDRYCVKEKKENAEGIGYICQLDIEGLLGEVFELIVGVNDDIPTLFKRIDYSKSGWTIECDSTFTKRRTINLEYFNLWNLITEVIKVYTCEIKIDSINRIVYFTEKVGNDNDVYFAEGLNIDETGIEIVSDSYDLYTRIVPLGVGKTDIGTVNGGKPYIDNFQYMDKVKTFYWKDERYTDLKQLKEDATIRLNEISKPRNTINTTIRNLANISGEYEYLRVNIGDIITILSKGKKEKYRVTELTEHPHSPFNDSITLDNSSVNLSSYLQDRENDISKLDLSFEKITVKTGLISSKVQKVEYDIEKQEIRINSAEEKITPEAITHTVTSSKEYINDMGERVTIEQIGSEIIQNATSVITAINSKDGTTSTTVDENGLTVKNGKFKVYKSGNSQYMSMGSNGLYYHDGYSRYYHYLTYHSTTGMGADEFHKWIQIPSEFIGKAISVTVGVREVSGGGSYSIGEQAIEYQGIQYNDKLTFYCKVVGIHKDTKETKSLAKSINFIITA